ncbi:MAG TPA: Rieske (2Fe-2S) protein [Acidimicrobiales bacterium]|nr:Rieske (2Fe-2S) protein [Acidimicrobiales bacterium]
MQLRRLPDAIESAAFLDRPAGALAGAVAAAVPAGPFKDALSGTWLGHALHPALTDLPIGFWTSAWVLDHVGGRRSAPAARTLVALGLLTAIPTAVAGANDWSDTDGPARRVGLVHATANSIAFACYAVSYVERRRGRRARGILWGWLGAGAASAGGALGGHLVVALGIGVDHTTFEGRPADWTVAGAAADLVENRPVAMRADGVPVLVYTDGDRLLALSDTCTHRGGPLHEGRIEAGCVVCPWHASAFRLEDGEVERGPATRPQPRFEARLRDGVVEVRAARSA